MTLLCVYIGAFLLAVVTAIIATFPKLSTARHEAVLQHLSLVVGHNLPLAQGVSAAALSERGALRGALDEIARSLELGAPLATAIRTSSVGMPAPLLTAIESAEHEGTLPTVLRQIARETRRPRNTHDVVAAWPYYLILALALCLAILLINTFLSPKFVDIYADFGVTSTLPMALGAAAFVQRNGVLFGLMFVVVVIVAAQFLFGPRLISRDNERVAPIFAATDTIAWIMPLTRRAAEVAALRRQLGLLAASVRAGSELSASADAAARVACNWQATRRMRAWARELAGGADPIASARDLGFPSAVTAALRQGIDGGDLGGALEYAQSYYDRLHVHWTDVIGALVSPLITLAMAALVGGFVVSVHRTYLLLIDSLIADIW